MTGGLFKEASRNPHKLLELGVRALVREELDFDFDQKMETLREGFVKNVDLHETHIARLLEDMKGTYPVIDWIPVPKNSTLDSLHTDMIVLRAQDEAACLQVTSDGVHGKMRRKVIREMFHEGAIAVVTTLGWEKGIKSDEILVSDLNRLLTSSELIKISL